jgi:FkbM family methyltransferase
VPIGPDERARIELTVSGRDTDAIAKVPDAGKVIDGVQVMHNGVRVVHRGYHGEWMAEIIARLEGHHEPQEERVFDAIVERLAATEPSPVMIELGAFWAYYALWLLQRIPAGRAFLVEPDPTCLDIGRQNFALNGRDGVFLQAAVGAASTPPQPFRCESDGVVRPIATESLPSLLERFGLERADLVLADVQGAELPLLDGGQEVLAAGRVRFLVVSTHHHVISGDPVTHQRCLELLRSLGAHVVAEHTVAESFSGDGLIAVSFDPRDRDMGVSIDYARASSTLFGDPVHDVAKAWRDRDAARADLNRIIDELAAAGSVQAGLQQDLTGARSELMAAQEALAAARSELAATQRELATIAATKTWRLRNRVVGVLAKLSRQRRARTVR